MASLERPGQYLGGEKNSIRKDATAVRASMAFAFPDAYEIGMSHLGLRLIYAAVNQQPDLLCERCFLPLDDLSDAMRQQGIPLFSWESRRPIATFDVIGFTLQYELCYTNILEMLDLSGLPLKAVDRPDWPLIIAGGPCVYNPEPLADFIDLFLIGDGEEAAVELLRLIAEVKAAGGDKQELLRRVAHLPGYYQPALYQAQYHEDGCFAALQAKDGAPTTITKLALADLDSAPTPENPLVAQPKAVHDRTMLEITRGCRFCQAGIIYRPVREKQAETLIQQARQQIEQAGYEDIALLSLSSTDYSQIEPLMDDLLAEHEPAACSISLPSLRVDAFSVALAAKTAKIRKSGLTLAPEAGSQRLRNIINKGVVEEDLWAATAAAFAQGYTGIKLYFMIGLPFETEQDLADIATMCKKILDIGRRNKPAEVHKPLKISLGISSFVPKPHTPFQYCPQNSAAQLQAKQDFLRQQIKPLRQVTLNYHDVRVSRLEAAFARGDRRLGAVLLTAYQSGCHLDGWSEHFRNDLWLEAFAAQGLTIEEFAERTYQPEQALPWQHIQTGVNQTWLAQEYAKAALAQLTPDCRRHGCTQCGVCTNLGLENRLASPYQGQRELAPEKLSQLNAPPVTRMRCRLGIQSPFTWHSHLELLSAMEKSLRRAKLPLAFSQGFNPHILLSWGPAHPVGVWGNQEYFDIYFCREPDRFWLQQLNATLPEGLTILEAAGVEMSKPALMAWLNFAAYRLPLPQKYDLQQLNQAIADFMAKQQYPVVRHSPKGNKTVDIRPSLLSLSTQDHQLSFTLRLDQGAAAKAQELAKNLIPGWQIGAVERTMLKHQA
ncbi:MAG: TIGR03960 family B12-binding radical SAM protein [Clostridiales bacterium]